MDAAMTQDPSFWALMALGVITGMLAGVLCFQAMQRRRRRKAIEKSMQEASDMMKQKIQ